ncbi:cysteine hydrolase family protein [Enterobacter sp.]|uniref:cysteine hydrolase family protein n=1 Tax=Enterobacter sp. TaxID=42895 RepID=UPI003D0E7AFC
MLVNGSLLGAVSEFSGPGKLAVLVIDMEDRCMGGGVGTNIRCVLELARLRNLPVWFIETMVPTSAALKNVLPPTTPTIRKQYFNAFVDTPLKSQLDAHGCKTVVVTGATAAMCVMNSVCGGMEFTDFKSRPGAIDLGFNVMTCQAVISGEVVGWSDNSKIQFYSSL